MLPAASTGGPVDAALVLKAARRAEALGFDGVYVGDHLLHPRPQLESLLALAGVASVTSHITIGTCVLLLALRDPLLSAKQLATLATLAPGRLRIGVGAGGEYPGEFEVAGVPLHERGHRLGDSVRTVRGILRHGYASGGLVLAAPVPEVPFFFGGWSEPALRRAAELGDGWIGYLLRPDSFSKRRQALVARRGDAFPTGMLVPVRIGGARLGEHWGRVTGTAPFPEDLFAVGSVAEVARRLSEYHDRGCDDFVLAIAAEGDEYLEQLERVADAVLPAL